MSLINRRSLVLSSASLLAAIVAPRMAFAQTTAPAAANRALFSITENDPARWNLVLGNMQNLRDGVGGEPIEIELVAYGPGLMMLKSDSVVKQRVAEAMKNGVNVDACQNTMKGMELTPADMLPDVGYVPAGVVEVMRKQQQGWAYIRS